MSSQGIKDRLKMFENAVNEEPSPTIPVATKYKPKPETVPPKPNIEISTKPTMPPKPSKFKQWEPTNQTKENPQKFNNSIENDISKTIGSLKNQLKFKEVADNKKSNITEDKDDSKTFKKTEGISNSTIKPKPLNIQNKIHLNFENKDNTNQENCTGLSLFNKMKSKDQDDSSPIEVSTNSEGESVIKRNNVKESTSPFKKDINEKRSPFIKKEQLSPIIRNSSKESLSINDKDSDEINSPVRRNKFRESLTQTSPFQKKDAKDEESPIRRNNSKELFIKATSPINKNNNKEDEGSKESLTKEGTCSPIRRNKFGESLIQTSPFQKKDTNEEESSIRRNNSKESGGIPVRRNNTSPFQKKDTNEERSPIRRNNSKESLTKESSSNDSKDSEETNSPIRKNIFKETFIQTKSKLQDTTLNKNEIEKKIQNSIKENVETNKNTNIVTTLKSNSLPPPVPPLPNEINVKSETSKQLTNTKEDIIENDVAIKSKTKFIGWVANDNNQNNTKHTPFIQHPPPPPPPPPPLPPPPPSNTNINFLKPNELEDDTYDIDEDLTCEPWYYSVSKDTASKLMKDAPKGHYMVRPSDAKKYVLMLRLNESIIKKFKIQRHNEGWILGEIGENKKIHESISQLMEFYIKNGLKINNAIVQLKEAVKKH